MQCHRRRRVRPLILGATAAACLAASGCGTRSWAPAVSLGVTAKRAASREPRATGAGSASGWSTVGTLRLQLLGPSTLPVGRREGARGRAAPPVHASAPCRAHVLCLWEDVERRAALLSFGVDP